VCNNSSAKSDEFVVFYLPLLSEESILSEFVGFGNPTYGK